MLLMLYEVFDHLNLSLLQIVKQAGNKWKESEELSWFFKAPFPKALDAKKEVGKLLTIQVPNNYIDVQ